MVFKGPLNFFIIVFIFFSQSVPIRTSGLFHQKSSQPFRWCSLSAWANSQIGYMFCYVYFIFAGGRKFRFCNPSKRLFIFFIQKARPSIIQVNDDPFFIYLYIFPAVFSVEHCNIANNMFYSRIPSHFVPTLSSLMPKPRPKCYRLMLNYRCR